MATALHWLRKLMKKILVPETRYRILRRRHALRLEWLEDRIQPAYSLSTLANFDGNAVGGQNPSDSLLEDRSGNLFGTTNYQLGYSGDGTIFEWVKSSGTLVTLATFNGSNGISPNGQGFQGVKLPC